MNDAVRLELSRRRRHRHRHRLLGEMLDELDATAGRVDERLVRKYMELLG